MVSTSVLSRSISVATSLFENSPSSRFVPSVTRFLTRMGSCLLSGLVRCVGSVIVRQGYVWTPCSSCTSWRFITDSGDEHRYDDSADREALMKLGETSQ